MSRRCAITNVGPLTGNTRSHSLRATRRRWNVNLVKVKLEDENGRKFTARVSARTLRTLRKYQSEGSCGCGGKCEHEHNQQEVAN